MKPSMKLLTVVAALLIGALVVSAVHAQCVPAREFATKKNKNCGRSEAKTDIEIPLLQTDWVGIVWDVGNALNNNGGGVHVGTTATCPVANWWSQGGTGVGDPAGWAHQGFVGDPSCTLSGTSCPATLAALVENITADGLDAGFSVTATDADAACSPRYWNFARAVGAYPPAQNLPYGMYAHPRVGTVTSSGPPPTTTLTNTYRDMGAPPHQTVFFTAPGGPAPAGGVITSYDVYIHEGTSEPATNPRQRSSWTFLRSVQYNNGPIADSFLVPCNQGPASDTYVAVGVTFDGIYINDSMLPVNGIHSYYLGKSTVVECDPNLADPDDVKLTRPRRKTERRPSTRRGR